MTPMIDPPLAMLAMMTMEFMVVPIRRPATQYSSLDDSTRREASRRR